MKKNAPLLIIAVIGIVLGVLWGERQRSPVPAVTTAVNANQAHLPVFELPTPDGQLISSSRWDGKVRVVNFWATWCPPCREEMPLFVRLQAEFSEQGVQFVGIALDDATAVAAFAAEFAINYPLLISNEDTAALSQQLGNQHGGLPFTVIVDTEGKIVARHTGELPESKLRPLLERLTQVSKNSVIASKTVALEK